MPNPFLNWTPEQVEAHNARVGGAKEPKSYGDVSGTYAEPSKPAKLSPTSVDSASTRQFVIPTDPCPAPRMTRQDRWLGQPGRKPRRPCVQRYFDYRAVLQSAAGDLPIVPDEMNAVFHFAMPASWSKKRRQEMNGQPHRQRPDGDNCTKAIQDALFLEDGGVWRGAFEKRWAQSGRVEITMVWR